MLSFHYFTSMRGKNLKVLCFKTAIWRTLTFWHWFSTAQNLSLMLHSNFLLELHHNEAERYHTSITLKMTSLWPVGWGCCSRRLFNQRRTFRNELRLKQNKSKARYPKVNSGNGGPLLPRKTSGHQAFLVWWLTFTFEVNEVPSLTPAEISAFHSFLFFFVIIPMTLAQESLT